MNKKHSSSLVKNRKASHEYHIMETFEAGVALVGSEVKSLKSGKGQLSEAYIIISDSFEAWLKNSHISSYHQASSFAPEEKRQRKLLLHKREIQKLKDAVKLQGQTIIPLEFYLSKGFIKLKIAIAKGKQLHDKRESLKKKSIEKMIRSELG